MGLPIDPVGRGKIKYQKKLRKDRSKAEIVSFPVFEDGKWKVYTVPYFPIEVLEYGPWEDHPAMNDQYPMPGMGTPGIGSGGLQPEEGEGEGEGGQPQPGGGGQPQPGPGSGEPGTPLYPPPGEGEGPYAGNVPIDPVYGTMDEEKYLDIITDELELEMLKPGKKMELETVKFPTVGYSGPKSLLDWDETIDASIERQELWKILIDEEIKRLKEQLETLDKKLNGKEISELEHRIKSYNIKSSIEGLENLKRELPEGDELKITVEREDERYRLPEIVYREDKEAIVIYIRDVSGSITDSHLKASYRFTKYIDAWIKKSYHNKVERVYIAHNYDAWEETEEGYSKLQSGGGTRFASAYELILAMIEGKEYKTKMPQRRKIDPNLYDLYVVQMTDGFGETHETEVEPLKKLMPQLTRFCYLEEKIDYGSYDSGYKQYLENTFSQELQEGKLRTAVITDINDIQTPLKAFFGKRKYEIGEKK